MIDLVRRGQSSVYGQVSVTVKGNTWTNKAGAGDTSPKTIALDSAKTYLLIKTDSGTVNIDGVDTAVPAKITGKTSTVLTWASGKIALYELSTIEAAETAAALAARYHYVSGTKSTNSVRVKSVGKNLFDNSISPAVLSTDGATLTILSDGTYRVSSVLSDGSAPKIFIKVIDITPYLGKQLNISWVATPSATNAPCLVLYQCDGTFDGKTSLGGVSGSGEKSASLTLINDISKRYLLIGFYAHNGATGSGLSSFYVDYTKIQIEEGSTATTYEPYKESIVNVNLPEPLRSLPNGVKDEVNVVSGVKTQRVSNTYIVKEGDVAHLLLDAYEDYDIVRFDNINELWVPFITSKGTLVLLVDNRSITEYNSSILWCWYIAGTTPKTFRVIVPKGFFTDLNAVKSYFAGATLIYQLAEPVVTQLDPQPLTIFPNGTQYIEFGTKEVAEYADGINISNAEIPIKAMKTVDKLHIEDGHWKRTAIDLANVAVSPDGLSFTIADAVNGETYEYSYDYDSALSTMPDLEVGEPSLVTRNNRTIVL